MDPTVRSILGENEDDDFDWKDVLPDHNDIYEIERQMVIDIVEEKYEDREVLKDALIKVGVSNSDAALIALEWGSSQAVVTKRYLSRLSIPSHVLPSAYRLVKLAYALMSEEEGPKIYAKFTNQ